MGRTVKKIFIPLLTVCFAGTALLADPGAVPGHKLADTALRSDSGDNQEHKLADTAYAAGDYANAVSGYRSATRLADEQKDVEQWARSALKLADSMLRHGDINGARGIYQEFRQRNPLRSAGTLPGDLLSAEGKYVDAEKFLIALEQSNPEFADAALFSRGMVKMRSGDIAEAYKIFAGLAKRTSPWAQQARYEMIYALIHLGKSGEALAELGNIPAAERSGYWELYHFLIDAHSGKCAELKKNFDKFIEKQPSYPAARLMELLAAAANAAVKNSS
jgi:thioredoxin-like negative regulator of GroEL